MVDLKQWLEGLSLGQYAQSFAANDIDFDILPDLAEADLERLGLSLGSRKRLRKAMSALDGPVANAVPAFIVAPISSAEASSERQAERRQVTVMFCDLVGSTELSARLDPEDLRDTLRAYQEMSAAVIERFDGFVAQYRGDGILAYFGYPRAHDDEAARAVRAGLAILDAMAESAAGAEIGFKVRIGIATGPTIIGDVIGRSWTSQIEVTGKTPNIAARVQDLALPGTLAVADSTYRLIAGLFECEPLGPQRLKGIAETVPIWRVLRELSDTERFLARRKGFVHYVGREQEMGVLLERWQLTEAGTGQAIVVSGEAGIGKSRLVARFREQLVAGTYVDIRLQCAEQYRNSPLSPVIARLKDAASFASSDSAAAKLAKIEALLAMAGRKESAPLVAALLSVPFGDRYPPLEMSPARQSALTRELMIEQVTALAAQKSVLLVIEDAHWLDPTTEEILIRLLERLHRHRILMVLTARAEHAVSLADHPQTITLTLGRFGPREAGQLIASLSGEGKLAPDVIDLILDKADGVPLFIEELTKSLLEAGVETLDASRGSSAVLSIPSTLEDTLRARLDRLASVKDIAQVGAAIGRTFSHRLLAAVANRDDEWTHQALERLVDAKLIYRHGTPPDARYTFKHALVQDAAYDSLLRSQRVQLHARIVAAVETGFPEMAETEPELLAHHASRAELGEKAIHYWLKAGTRAIGRSANIEAMRHLKKGLDRLNSIPASDGRARWELQLQLRLGQASIAACGYTAAETKLAFTRAEQLVEKVGDEQQRYSALYGIFVGHLIGGDMVLAAETIGRMRQLAKAGGEDAYLCLACRLSGSLDFFRGDLAAAHEELARAVALHGPEQQRRLAFHFGPDTGLAAQIFLAMTEWLRGRPERAHRLAADAVRTARALDNALTLGQVLTLAAQLHYMARDYESMFRLSQEGDDICKRISILYFGSISRLFLVWAEAWRSNPAHSIDAFRRGLEAYRAMGSELQLGLFQMMLTQLFLAAGAPAEAAREGEAALQTIIANGEGWWAPEIYRTLGDTQLALPTSNAAEAETYYRHAITEARRIGALMLELRATTSLARLLLCRGNGNEEEAHRTLSAVVAKFDEGFGTAELGAAQALLSNRRSYRSRQLREIGRRSVPPLRRDPGGSECFKGVSTVRGTRI